MQSSDKGARQCNGAAFLWRQLTCISRFKKPFKIVAMLLLEQAREQHKGQPWKVQSAASADNVGRPVQWTWCIRHVRGSGNHQRRGVGRISSEREGFRMEAVEGRRGPVALHLPGNPHRVQVGGVQHVDQVHPYWVQARPHLHRLPAQRTQDSQWDCQHLVTKLIYKATSLHWNLSVSHTFVGIELSRSQALLTQVSLTWLNLLHCDPCPAAVQPQCKLNLPLFKLSKSLHRKGSSWSQLLCWLLALSWVLINSIF